MAGAAVATKAALTAARVAARQAVRVSARIASRSAAKSAVQAARTAARSAARSAARALGRAGRDVMRRGVSGSLRGVGQRALSRSPKLQSFIKSVHSGVKGAQKGLDNAAKAATVTSATILALKASGKLSPEQEAKLDKLDKQLKKDSATVNRKEIKLSDVKGGLDATEKGLASTST